MLYADICSSLQWEVRGMEADGADDGETLPQTASDRNRYPKSNTDGKVFPTN